MLFLVSLTFIACTTKEDEVIAPINSSDGLPLTAGSADFSKYVALGNSLSAGYTDGALFKKGQENSWTKILSEQMKLVGGGEFRIPYIENNTGGLLIGGQVNSNFLPRLFFNGKAPSRLTTSPNSEIFVSPTTEATTILTGPFNNMGVPGAKSFHLLYDGYGNAQNLPTLTANPYFVRFAKAPNSTVLGDALAQLPTFFSLWIGNNDVLGYSLAGGDPAIDTITSTPLFEASYTALITNLTAKAKGVIANIPDVTSIPFFTTIPYNPLTSKGIGEGDTVLGDTRIDQANAGLYGPLKAVLTQLGAGDRINMLSKTTTNPLLMKDETITDYTPQLTAAFQAYFQSLGDPNYLATGGAFGAIYGQARQTKSTDLILLTTQGVIGSSAPGVPASINKFGISYPLQDKHILIPTEVTQILDATAAFNTFIKAKATEKGLAFVDANAILGKVAKGGVASNGFTMTSALVFGNAFSLDGVHPTSRGYALIANEFAKAINKTYGSNLPAVDVGKYNNLFPFSL